MSATEHYHTTGQQIAAAVPGQMFGKPCFKIRGKAFICFFKECMVFKLQGIFHEQALALEGALLFDPSGKGRPMKAWVQVPFAYKDKWPELAEAACACVAATA